MRRTGIDHPIDALAAQGLLAPRADGETEHDWRGRNVALRDGALRFARLHRQLFGNGLRSVGLDAPRGAMPALPAERPIDRLAAQRYRQSREALLAASRRVLDAVSNAAIYLRPLPDAATRPAQHRIELAALRRGLGILADLPTLRVEADEGAVPAGPIAGRHRSDQGSSSRLARSRIVNESSSNSQADADPGQIAPVPSDGGLMKEADEVMLVLLTT